MNNESTTEKTVENKIHSKNEFELCYLRHKYVRRVQNQPTKADMQPFMPIVRNFSKKTYDTYRNLFVLIGFEKEDIVSISTLHLSTFLGLFSLDKMPDKYAAFMAAYKNPNKEDFTNRDKANFTMFLKQRLEEVVRICRQKARNIKGFPTEEHKFFYGPDKPPKLLSELLTSNDKYGFKKIDSSIFRTIKNRAKEDSLTFKFDNNYYVAVPIEQKNLSMTDLSGADLNPRDSIHNMTPEEIFCATESNSYWDSIRQEFDNKTPLKKKTLLRKFLKKHRGDPKYKEELKVARKFLKSIGA